MVIRSKAKNTADPCLIGRNMKILDILLESVNPDIKQAQDILVSKGLLAADAVDGTLNDATKAALDKLFGGTAPATNPAGTTAPTSTNYKSAPGAVDPKEMKAYLLKKGYDNNQAAGLLVNIKWESHFKPGAFVKSDNNQGPSGGLMGFHDPKFDGRGNFSDMVKFCGGPTAWQTNWQGQLDFALSKQLGQQYKGIKFATPGDAAAWWVTNYEKPADTQGQAVARSKDAAQYA